MRDKFPAKWSVHMTGMNFQTRSKAKLEKGCTSQASNRLLVHPFSFLLLAAVRFCFPMCNKVCNIICHLQRTAKAFGIYCKLDRIFHQELRFCCFSLVIFHDKCANALYQNQSWLFVILCHKGIQYIFCLINISHK
ncbi:DUF6783 domain-containing protein [Blautia sp. HCP3S3_G3]|uniref:DUF6783 domain-containing protein n=1 Tax=Blautia sp. HCP3S3_G3 TaxID=3438913 RepID=UPI003F8C5397